MMYEYRQWRLKGSLFLVMMPLMIGAMEQEEEVRIDGMNLMGASDRGHKEIVDKLIEQGADIDVVDKNGWTALMKASDSGHKEIVDKLIEQGADIDTAADQDGWTALMGASDRGHKEIVDKLIEQGANIDPANQYGETALMWASNSGHKEIVDKLIEKGADIDAANQYGETALMWASNSGHKEIVDKLIEKGTDIDPADQDGWTALMGASSEGHKEIVDKLIKSGADPYIKNGKGKDCLDVADNKELKNYIGVKYKIYKKRCIEHLAAFLQKGGTKNGRYCDWSGGDTEKKSGPFEKDIALHIAQIRYGVTENEWRQMCRLENEEN